MPLTSGTRLGRYEVQGQLGAGGMGEIYLARDTQLDRTIALKILRSDVASDTHRMRRFIQEAKAASSLNHPNILTIYEIGQSESTHFIATELIEGETLRARMGKARLKLTELLDVAIQVASALAAAHEVGIVHRDIKPENIMVRRDGYVKVLDFGLAKLTGPPRTDREATTMVNTELGVIMGTVNYMSPEQSRGLETDARTDIWSLGVVLYEMVTGRLPFTGATSTDAIIAIAQNEPAQLGSHTPGVPVQLERIVRKALAKDREERYQTVKDVGLDLKGLRRELELEAELHRSMPSETRPASANTSDPKYEYAVSPRKRTAIVLITLVAGIAALSYLAYTRYYAMNQDSIDSIAVLPFTNDSGDPEHEYLSDGISESLINNLSQLPQLKVIARSSSFKFKGKNADPQQVAKALGVRAIVSGRVAQRGDQIHISAELMDIRDQRQIWGEQYNRNATDLLAVQSEISREIMQRLRLKLTNVDEQQLAQRITAKPEAYELLLRGRFYRTKTGSTQEQLKAVEYYTQAIAIDPTYALAYAELSMAYGALMATGTVDPNEIRPRVQAAARRALELDETLAPAHLVLSMHRLAQDDWDWSRIESGIKRTIELDPNFAPGHGQYALFLSRRGQHEHALVEARRAKELDPLSPARYWTEGRMLYYARRHDEAIEQFKKMHEIYPDYINAYVWRGYAHAAKGQYEEAITAYREGIKRGDDSTSTQCYLGYALAMSGKKTQALAIHDDLLKTKRYVSPAELAILYTGLDRKEEAFTTLERAYAAGDFQLMDLNGEVHYDSLRSDPRFKDLVRRVGLPQ